MKAVEIVFDRHGQELTEEQRREQAGRRLWLDEEIGRMQEKTGAWVAVVWQPEGGVDSVLIQGRGEVELPQMIGDEDGVYPVIDWAEEGGERYPVVANICLEPGAESFNGLRIWPGDPTGRGLGDEGTALGYHVADTEEQAEAWLTAWRDGTQR
jgi:hypothetical protein